MDGCVCLIAKQCCNPLKKQCENNDIVLYMQLGSERLPICKQCWHEMADLTIEWGDKGLKSRERHVVNV